MIYEKEQWLTCDDVSCILGLSKKQIRRFALKYPSFLRTEIIGRFQRYNPEDVKVMYEDGKFETEFWFWQILGPLL
jgi:hypothetical protein